jgi:hypothetical protein
MIKHKIEIISVIFNSSITALMLYGLILYPFQITGFTLIVTMFFVTSTSFIYTLLTTGFNFKTMKYDEIPTNNMDNNHHE